MVRILLKKQLMEVFRSYFYDSKKNKARSKAGIIIFFALFALVMVGILGGAFTFLAFAICPPLVEADMGWMFFVIMSAIGMALGVFGSVFNTYAGLYLSKDNDLLLSMPIPVRDIIAARLLNVYLMGLMYSSVVMIPAIVVYWIFAGFTVMHFLGCILLLVIVSAMVQFLSCVLGFGLAKLSQKLKNKSFITVLFSLLGIGAYYFFYFKANAFIRELAQNATIYGNSLRKKSYVLYQFGRVGEGSPLPMVIFLAVTVLLVALVVMVLSRSFLSIVAGSHSVSRIKEGKRSYVKASIFKALLKKEFARFTASPNYMLNCGLGIILLPAAGIFLLIKGSAFSAVMGDVFASQPGCMQAIIVAMLCLLSAMVDTAAPSVSLEGNNIWILQSLPVKPSAILQAKATMQLLLGGIPMFFSAICAAISCGESFAERLLMVLVPLIYAVFSAVFNTSLSVSMANLHWTNELTPIKQGGAITVALFSGWGIGIAIGGLFFILGHQIGITLYLSIIAVLLTAVTAILYARLLKKGAAKLATL